MADGVRAQASGVRAEALAEQALLAEGWRILGRRVRTPCGELDLVAEAAGLLAFIEVKHRASLGEAASALGRRQRLRLLAAAEFWLAANPGQGAAGIRFDVMLVDGAGLVRRIADAFRAE